MRAASSVAVIALSALVGLAGCGSSAPHASPRAPGTVERPVASVTSRPSTRPTAAPSSAPPTTTTTTRDPASGGVIPTLPPIAGLIPPGAETRSTETATTASQRAGVLVFGDSLVIDAWTYVQRIAAARGQHFDGGAFGGTALCDWLPSIERTLRDDKPSYLVVAFTGNNLTPCTRASDGRRRHGAPLVALYRRDTQVAITAAHQVGTRVFLVGPPAMRDRVSNTDAAELRTALRELVAGNPGVGYLDANQLLSPDGFRSTRPCLAFETAALGCRDGSIVIRSADGVHLESPPGGDRAYSPGSWQYARLLMRGVPNAS